MSKSYDVKNETPENIEELKKLASQKTSYKSRLDAVYKLREYKCRQSIDILWRLMMQDKVYAVQEEAFRALQKFGEAVKLPRKKKGHLVKDINKRIEKTRNSFKQEPFTFEEFKEKFQLLYPTEYDIYSYEKHGKMDDWLKNCLSSLPSLPPASVKKKD